MGEIRLRVKCDGPEGCGKLCGFLGDLLGRRETRLKLDPPDLTYLAASLWVLLERSAGPRTQSFGNWLREAGVGLPDCFDAGGGSKDSPKWVGFRLGWAGCPSKVRVRLWREGKGSFGLSLGWPADGPTHQYNLALSGLPSLLCDFLGLEEATPDMGADLAEEKGQPDAAAVLRLAARYRDGHAAAREAGLRAWGAARQSRAD